MEWKLKSDGSALRELLIMVTVLGILIILAIVLLYNLIEPAIDLSREIGEWQWPGMDGLR